MKWWSMWASALAVLIGVAVAPLPADAQPLPPGSYMRTCRDIQVRGWNLVALCETRQRGVFTTSRLDNFPSCGGDISNVNGRLWCERRAGPPPGPPPGPPRGPLPPGSYLQSCRNAVVIDGWLGAACRDTRGNWRPNQLNLRTCSARGDIANINGRLVCR